MPIYEYRCKKKGHIFEALQSFSEKPLKKCTKCDSPVERLISASAFHLKGEGWYVTDYKGKKSVAETSKSTKKTKSSESTSEAASCGTASCADSKKSAKASTKSNN